MDIIESILSKNVPLVHTIRKDIPPVISLIIDKLTRKAVDERYASAYGLKGDLLECQRRLRDQTEALIFFPLGQKDVNPVFKVADGIYGREKEQEIIHSIVERVSTLHQQENAKKEIKKINRAGCEIIVLKGPGGIGKSTLASMIHNQARHAGYTATAKFDRNQKSPYNGLLHCLSSILKQLLTEPESVVKEFYKDLKDNLGPQFPNVRLLVGKVPELKPILYGYKEKMRPVDDDALSSILNTEIRFHSVFLNIIKIIARRKMTTLCLDDLQEADEPSIRLISALILSQTTMLIILTFRDGSETPQIVIDMLKSCQERPITTIQLNPIPKSAIQELVRHTFYGGYDKDQLDTTRPLADLISTWTRGNPFYAKQFLKIMKRKGDIWFDWNDKSWKFRLDNIKHHDIFDIRQLVSHLKSLDKSTQLLLMWASLMGHVFNFSKIKVLLEFDAIGGLQTALSEGIIQYKAGDDFCFVHDRYCQAASMLITSKQQREEMHFKIGQILMSENEEDEEELDGRVYWVADHLLKSASLLQSSGKTRRYRKVLAKAGHEATLSGALQIATAYYDCAISLLPREKWQDGPDASFEETLNLFMRLLELINDSNTDITRREEIIDEILTHTKDRPYERAQIWRMQARACFQNTNYRQGVDIILKGLRELDITIDEKAADFYEQIKTIVNNIGFDTLVNRSEYCTDPKQSAVMLLLNEGCTGAYLIDPTLADCFGLKICELSLKSGYTSSSGGGFIWAGCAAARKSEFSFAAELGKFGLSVAERYAGNSEIARAIIIHHTMLAQWAGVPLQTYAEQFQKAYAHAVTGGDKLFSSLALFHVAVTYYWTSRNLSDIHWHLKKSMDTSKRTGIRDVTLLNISLWRSILVFQGRTDSVVDPDTMMNESENFDEISYVNDLETQGLGNALTWHYGFKMILLFHFGFFREAVETGEKIFDESADQIVYRHIGIAMYYHSLSLIECMREPELDPETREKYKMRLEGYKEKLGIMAAHSYVNYGLHYKILCAQISTLDNDLQATLAFYNRAIEHAQADNWVSVLGFIHELMTQHYMRCQLDMVAIPFLTKSIDYYRQWGAFGKIQYLQNMYGHLLEPMSIKRRDCEVQTEDVIVGFTTNVAEGNIWENHSDETATDPSLRDVTLNNDDITVSAEDGEISETTLLSLDMVDLTSIIKSTQVISNEMNSFDELLKKMIGIIMSNSGAESGAIIVKERQLCIAAYSTRSCCETYDPPLPLEDYKSISASIINYVIHTHSVLFIPNVEDDPRFVTNITKSAVMCMPILHKNTLVGVLYLQANINTFTHKHLNVLTLLCDQIGISITNALLFKSLQKATETNAQMIESQLKALEEAKASREQALRATQMKSNFLANMSHELRTPFSGFYGMISLLSETRLDAEQREFVSIAKQSCEMLLHIIDDLLDFSKLEAHNVKLHYGLFYVEDIIADRLELLITLAANKNVELSYYIDKDVPPIIYADGNRIGQVLLNLVGNAIKFTHYGEVVVHCSLDKEHEDGSISLKISVKDTGIGMSKEEMKGLFLPFSQVDGSTTRNFGGTGLGLSICLQLVKLMQGDIWVDSEVNQGSTFSFTVRVKNGDTVAAEPDGDPRCKVINDLLVQLHQPRILMVCQKRMKKMVEASLPWLSLDHMYTLEGTTQCIIEKAKNNAAYDCIIIDAPSPDLLRQLISMIESTPSLKHTRILILIAPVVDNIPRTAISSKPSIDLLQHHFLFHPLITRISKPVRQVKLLKALVSALGSSKQKVEVNEPVRPVDTIKEKPMATFSTARQTQEVFSPEELALFKGQKILVAEDNSIAQKLIMKQLEKLGFIVEACNNGFECFDTWKARGPGYFSLAWIDHHMPGCDGIEATKKIRAYEKKMNYDKLLPIIALTADIQITAQENCLKAGMNDYVTKPLMQKDLVIILRKYCFASAV
ncbi:unnamed protein product [Rhizopus microsporus]